MIIMNNNFNNKDISGWFFERLYVYSNKCRILFLGWYYKLYIKTKGVKYGANLLLNGRPLVRRAQGSNITLGYNVTLNSAKNSVTVGLSGPCTLVTHRKGAEITVGDNSGASGLVLVAASKISIGNNVLIGSGCTIVDNDFHNADPKKRNDTEYSSRPVTIEDNVFIGFNCFILKGVTIGENSIIGANSTVINSIPKNSIAIGNPCKVVIIKNWDSK